jgi:hypothetical protein
MTLPTVPRRQCAMNTAARRIDAQAEQRVVTLPLSVAFASAARCFDGPHAGRVLAALFYGTRSSLWRAADLGIFFDRRSTCRSFNLAGSWSITLCCCNNNKHHGVPCNSIERCDALIYLWKHFDMQKGMYTIGCKLVCPLNKYENVP